jgi:hypothetical protein
MTRLFETSPLTCQCANMWCSTTFHQHCGKQQSYYSPAHRDRGEKRGTQVSAHVTLTDVNMGSIVDHRSVRTALSLLRRWHRYKALRKSAWSPWRRLGLTPVPPIDRTAPPPPPLSRGSSALPWAIFPTRPFSLCLPPPPSPSPWKAGYAACPIPNPPPTPSGGDAPPYPSPPPPPETLLLRDTSPRVQGLGFRV